MKLLYSWRDGERRIVEISGTEAACERLLETGAWHRVCTFLVSGSSMGAEFLRLAKGNRWLNEEIDNLRTLQSYYNGYSEELPIDPPEDDYEGGL